MNLSKLQIVGITYSHSQKGAYTLLLENKLKKIKVPIVIGAFEAQAIALALEQDFVPSRPLTHELFFDVLNNYSIKIKSVLIHQLIEGIFYTTIFFEQNDEEKKVGSRVSDAVALATRFNAPILVTDQVLEDAGVEIDIHNTLFKQTEEKEEENDNEFNEDDHDVFDHENEESNILETIFDINKDSKQKILSNLSIEELKDNLQDALDYEDFEFAILLRDELNKRIK